MSRKSRIRGAQFMGVAPGPCNPASYINKEANAGVDLYWVSDESTDWFDGMNWSLSSDGAPGAGYPGATNDVYIDGRGTAVCTLSASAVCKDFNLVEIGHPIQGDFDQNGQAFSCANFIVDNDGEFGTFDEAITVSGDITWTSWGNDTPFSGGGYFITTGECTITSDRAIDYPYMVHQNDVTYANAAVVQRCDCTSGITLTVKAGAIFNLGSYTSGDWDGITIQSEAGEWTLNNAGLTMVVSDSTIYNSDADDAIDATDNCVDGGGNTNWTFLYLFVSNFEADTVSENEATIEAKSTHYDVHGVSGAVGLVSTRAAIRDARLVNAWLSTTGTPSQYEGCANAILVGVGDGFVPSDGGTLRMECILYGQGGSVGSDVYATSLDGNDGFTCRFTGANLTLNTISGGAWTLKQTAAHGLASTSFGTCWFVHMLEYNFATNAFKQRVIELGTTGPTQEDTGWKSITVSGPTFDSSTEIRKFSANAWSQFAGTGGQAQIWVSDDTNAFIDGAAATANYTVPT